ncbi:MAG: SpoIIE family protein phosphatase [Planctomycetes bacterium]|nr:SpoIIE family protein phosphatase [Planctomycetota bacterium]
MSGRFSHFRGALVLLFVLANAGALSLGSSGHLQASFAKLLAPALDEEQAAAILFLLWNAVLAAVLVGLDFYHRSLRRELRELERKTNRLELLVADTAPETQVLETLSELSVQFLDRIHLMPLLKRMATMARQVLKADVCALEIFSDTTDHILLVDGLDRLSFGREVYKRVIDQGSSILINNIQNHPRYRELADQNLLGMMLAPFQLRGRVIGIIGAFSRVEGNFTGRDLRLLHVFAQHAALLIEATQLMEAVRRLSLRSNSEDVADLAHLRERLSQERELADYEMGVARRIQKDLLPRKLPDIPDAKVEALSLPAKEVGGDFYDVMDLGDGRWGLVIGDVSGKGVPAALVTAMSQTVLHLVAASGAPPSEVLSRLNAMLVRETQAGMFVSMFYGIWDKARRTLSYCNAGHEHPLLFARGKGDCQYIECGGIALGAVEDVKPFLEDREFCMQPGDTLLLYTDGVVEAKNKANSMFGLDRLREDVVRIAHETRNGYLQALVRDIDAFVSGAEQHDDITLLALSLSEVKGAA